MAGAVLGSRGMRTITRVVLPLLGVLLVACSGPENPASVVDCKPAEEPDAQRRTGLDFLVHLHTVFASSDPLHANSAVACTQQLHRSG